MIKFVEQKAPDMARIAALLDKCHTQNHWANRGPLYHQLAAGFVAHFALSSDRAVVPCANAGVALDVMSRLLGQSAGRALRWVGSAFSFQNLGRGHFADMQFVDCTAQGLLDLDLVRALDPESFDGIVVVNPFGLFRDFSAYISYARETGKALLLDNAAGVDRHIPDWPWQAFSLHQTKPYGVGEGGLAITPTDRAEDFYALINYGATPDNPADWFNNGKISDIACAFLIDRLERLDQWGPSYQEQAARVAAIAGQVGLRPIRPFGPAAPATSWVYVADKPIPMQAVMAAKAVTFGKYYKPLSALPRTTDLFAHLVNIPTHPDMARLSDADLRQELERLLD